MIFTVYWLPGILKLTMEITILNRTFLLYNCDKTSIYQSFTTCYFWDCLQILLNLLNVKIEIWRQSLRNPCLWKTLTKVSWDTGVSFESQLNKVWIYFFKSFLQDESLLFACPTNCPFYLTTMCFLKKLKLHQRKLTFIWRVNNERRLFTFCKSCPGVRTYMLAQKFWKSFCGNSSCELWVNTCSKSSSWNTLAFHICLMFLTHVMPLSIPPESVSFYTPRNLEVFDVFKGYVERPKAWDGLMLT